MYVCIYIYVCVCVYIYGLYTCICMSVNAQWSKSINVIISDSSQ